MRPEDLLLHADFVRRLSRRLVFDEHLTADLVQEVCVAALKKPPPSSDALKGWFARVTRNLAGNLVRSEVRRNIRERAAAGENRVPSTADVVEREEIRRRVVEAVLSLPQTCRSAVLLRFYEGLPPRKVAKELQVPVETAKTRIKRGLALMREKLDADHGGDRRKWLLTLTPLAGSFAAASSTAAPIPLLTGALAMSAKMKASFVAALILVVTASVLILLSDVEDIFSEENSSSILSIDLEPETAATPPGVADDEELLHDTSEMEAIAAAAALVPVSGVVLAKATGRAVGGAEVTVAVLPRQRDLADKAAQSGNRGEFSLEMELPTGATISALDFHISAPGFKNLEIRRPWNEGVNESRELSFHLEEDRVHTLRVVDMQGKRIPDAKVEVFSSVMNRTLIRKYTDFEGEVTITEGDLGWESGYRQHHDLAFRITARGKDTYLHLGRTVPKKIRMREESEWRCRVHDAKTGVGIPGARVSIQPQDDPCLKSWLGLENVTTDTTGAFHMPRITLSNRFPLVMRIRAAGYMPENALFAVGEGSKVLPERIPMRPAARVVKVLATEETTGKPLPHLEICLTALYKLLSPYHEIRFETDESGCFDCPFLLQEKNYSAIRAPDFCIQSHPFPHPDSMTEEPWPLVLRAQTTERVKVVDTFGKPVPRARVHLVHCTEKGEIAWYDRGTNMEGLAEFNPSHIPQGTDAWFLVNELGRTSQFAPSRTEPFRIGESKGGLRTIVLERGILLQNIKVVDTNSLPASGQTVVATLDLGKGFNLRDDGLWRVNAITDSRGLCDIAFPHFLEGAIGVEDRPDTNLAISFKDVIDQKEITFVLGPADLQRSGVTGRILDNAGNPVGGAVIFLIYAGHTKFRKYDYRLVTAPDGTFSTPVDSDKSYSLVVRDFERKEAENKVHWFTGVELHSVKEGDFLEIVLDSWTSKLTVNVMDCGFAVKDFEVWLEDHNGLKVMVGRCQHWTSPLQDGNENSTNLHAAFFDVPPGLLKAMFKTDVSRIICSDTIEFHEGESKSVEIDG